MNTVLLADSEPWQRLLTREILSAEPSLRLMETGDGEEAYTLVVAHQPHVALIDVLLPHLDGLALCRLIKAHPALQHTHVIILTALSDEAQGREAGCDAYLIRPCEPDMLLYIVCQALGIPG